MPPLSKDSNGSDFTQIKSQVSAWTIRPYQLWPMSLMLLPLHAAPLFLLHSGKLASLIFMKHTNNTSGSGPLLFCKCLACSPSISMVCSLSSFRASSKCHLLSEALLLKIATPIPRTSYSPFTIYFCSP